MSVTNARRDIVREVDTERPRRPGGFTHSFGFGQSLRDFVEGHAQVYEEVVPVEFGQELERGLVWAGLGLCTGLVLLFAAPGLISSINNRFVFAALGLLATLKWWLILPCLVSLGLYIHLFLKTDFKLGTLLQLRLAIGLWLAGWFWILVLGCLIVPLVLGWVMALVATIIGFFVNGVWPILAAILLIGLFVEGPIVLLGFAAIIFMVFRSLIEWIFDR